MQNWAGNHTFAAGAVYEPTNVAEVIELVASHPKLRVVGSRHSFNDIADCPGGALISLGSLNRIISLDARRATVTIESGITYGQLAPYLQREGCALRNLASLPHISVAGAIATGTHGSGAKLGSLSTSVAGLELVTADGTVRNIARGEDDFDAAVVGLGALGVVTKLTLDVVPAFGISQRVYQNLPMAEFLRQFEPIINSVYSISLFTDWQSETINQVWTKALRGQTPFDLTQLGAVPATRQLHPIEGPLDSTLSGIDPSKCTPQLGVPGAWHERLPHFELEFTPSSGEELQSEYFVPRARAAEAYAAVASLKDKIRPLIQICELRFIAADELWLSPSFGRPTAAIHFTWRKNQAAVDALLHELEATLQPFDARPHWGKVFVMEKQRLRAVYPKLEEFNELAKVFDPNGKFRNAYLERVF